ncbi:MAG: peptidoglycan DD-metalloendopeptidase family protein [Sedimentisphaerales bacterium]|nr:peptidoglycan DD-metalloendopeptidase family protein [Sedimentisphaerales bacterium]
MLFSSKHSVIFVAMTLALLPSGLPTILNGQAFQPTIDPLLRVVDLNVGESQTIKLHDGSEATVKLLDLKETRDALRQAVRHAEVRVLVNNKVVTLVSSTYRLPTTIAGVRIDCPVTKGYLQKSSKKNAWAMDKDARLRLWPAGSPLTTPGTFVYPVKQRWFADDTQMANVPCFVNGCEKPADKNIYYHNGLDFGGAEGLVEVVAAAAGTVISSVGEKKIQGDHPPVRTRNDVVYIRDERGWYYRYSHLYNIDKKIIPGAMVKMGQKIGLLGKEGPSGGWAHLHFDIKAIQPSGNWGVINSYAFAWEAYQRQYHPEIIAVARPHHLAWAGEKVLLDGTRSWSSTGRITRYDWTFFDGSTGVGAKIERTYNQPGAYSEVLKITDAAGRTDYDFAVVQIIDKNHPDQLSPTIHAAYYPTFGITPGDEVTFKVRTFRDMTGRETWDFGDGSPSVTVQSDGNRNHHDPQGYAVTTHRYQKPGHYLVTVSRRNERGEQATTHLQVRVGRNK